jgi:hypothetical protein
MSIATVAHGPSVGEDADTSPAKAGEEDDHPFAARRRLRYRSTQTSSKRQLL